MKHLVYVGLALILAACGSSPTDSTTSDTPPVSIPTNVPDTASVRPTNNVGQAVVARVNGEDITLPEFEREMARRQQIGDAATSEALGQDVLNDLIQGRLVTQGAQAQNLSVTDAQVQAELQANIEAAGGSDAWNQWLTTNLYSADEYERLLRLTLTFNQVRDALTADLAGDVAQVHARHILVRTEAEANAVMQQLSAGADFAALAAQLSVDDTTRERGGDLGWFTQEELLVPDLAQTAFMLLPGQIGGPVATELGYHIVQTLEAAQRPVEPERRVYIAEQRFDNWLTPLYANAVIERFIS